MCEPSPKKPNIAKKKPKSHKTKQLFLTPTAFKKSQICEIWLQKSQSGNNEAWNVIIERN